MDKNSQEFNLIAPDSMEISYKDKEGIYEIIDCPLKKIPILAHHPIQYTLTADKSLPSLDKVEGTLSFPEKGDIIIKMQLQFS